MDDFRVPKKVNRNVFKAISILQSSRTHFVRVNAITDQVKYQMRNLVPVAHVDEVIKESLNNLTNLGIVRRLGSSRYALSNVVYARMGVVLPNSIASTPGNPGTPLRRAVQNARRKRNLGRLDPWKSVTKILSADSLSGTEIDKTRKRMRGNTKRVVKQKREIFLPQTLPKQSKETDSATTTNKQSLFDEKYTVPRGSGSLLGIDYNKQPTSVGPTTSGKQIEFGSPGWKYTIPNTPATPQAPMSLNQKTNDPSSTTSVISENIVTTSAMDVKGNVEENKGSEASISCRAVPVGLDVRPADHTSGGESDVENASVVGLCGSPICLRTPTAQPSSHESALEEKNCPWYSQSSILHNESKTLGIQPIIEDQGNTLVEESSKDHISTLQENDGALEISLDIQTNQTSDVLGERGSSSDYDFYK
ncbi:uncharacterized protein LOC6553730 [Drosophila erecta]|uniref:GG18960 n=1 Tax=Drosophila erecta TaxID=7220 RepID=B3P4B2_DROER|nr:uncharacterized protein LOC6553730 [Drosophila erecta]EDV49357.1 uncharacterized protein Dere_GG18960 [Drosophila erecta]